jgi:hypothetical protein
MSHIGGASSNITVVQRVTPALRVNIGFKQMQACRLIGLARNVLINEQLGNFLAGHSGFKTQ